MTALDFTYHKFLRLCHSTQHKHCAALLSSLYESLEENAECIQDTLEQYHLLCKWISQEPLKIVNQETVSNRYHFHYQNTHLHLQEQNFLPKVKTGDKSNGEKPWPIVVFLDNLRSAHNVGSILRTVEAFSLGKVIFSEHTPNASHPQVCKTSMGTSEWIDWDCKPVTECPKPLIALETIEGAKSLYNFSFPESFTLAVGNEEYGCSQKTLQLADFHIEIPLRGRKNSLNVANSFAIAAAEIQRQRINLGKSS